MWTYEGYLLRETGRLFDQIPFTNVSFDDSLNNGGQFTGELDIDAAVDLGLQNFTSWMTRLVIVPCRDGQPWGAFLWMTTAYDLQSPKVKIGAKRFDAVFDERNIEGDLVFTQKDQLAIFIDLINYGRGLGTTVTDAIQIPDVGWSGAAAIPWLQFGGATTSGVLRDRTKVVNGQEDDGYRLKGRKAIGAAVQALSELENGFEYRIDYLRDSTGQFLAQYTLGYPTVGVDKSLTFEWPGGNIASGSWAADGAPFKTRVDVIGGMLGDNPYIGTARAYDLMDAGYPYRSEMRTESSITEQATLDAKAAGRLAQIRKMPAGYSIELDGTKEPTFGTYNLGDTVLLRIRRGGVLTEQKMRLTGWSVKPDSTGVGEKVTPVLAEVP